MAPAMLRLELRAGPGMPLSQLKLDQLRFFLSGDDLTVRTLYELVFNHVTQVVFRAGSAASDPAPLVQNADCLQMVGFGRDEGLLPFSPRSFLGYRLLTEYFAFSQKFLFVDICGLERIAAAQYRDRLEIYLFLDRNVPELETRVKTEMFRLGCCPIINLFRQEADPIRLSQPRPSTWCCPTCVTPARIEVYSVDRVHSTNLDTHQTTDYEPFYSLKHGRESSTDPSLLVRPTSPVDAQGRSWHRRLSVAGRRRIQSAVAGGGSADAGDDLFQSGFAGNVAAHQEGKLAVSVGRAGAGAPDCSRRVTDLAGATAVRTESLAADLAPGVESALDLR